MKKLVNATTVIFALIVLLESGMTGPVGRDGLYVAGLAALIEAVCIVNLLLPGDPEKKRTVGDVSAVVLGLLFTWELVTARLNLLDKMLFPSPGQVIVLFIADMPTLLRGLGSSLQLLAGGYLLALAAAVPLALVIGWRKRLLNAVSPITKVLGPIPPIVYIPYAIGLLPTFTASSIFIIFVGAFWPVFINTLNGVSNVDRRIIDSARALNVSEAEMLLRVILPGALPSIISGATISLVLSFILLTAAEMIGATSGLGWYVKYFADFADYPRVIVGIVFIGIVVTAITFLFDKTERYLLRWKK